MNNNQNLNAKLIQNEHIGIQQINIPGSGGIDYPEALPAGDSPFGLDPNQNVQTGQKPTTTFTQNKNVSEGLSHIRGTEISQLNANYMRNSSKIMSLDAKLKALEKQLESYKWASNDQYYQVMEEKIATQNQYQLLVQEQNLIQQEIDFRTAQKLAQKNKKLKKGLWEFLRSTRRGR